MMFAICARPAQGLKPGILERNGTAKAVPFHKTLFMGQVLDLLEVAPAHG